jgi:hypothetical protein
MADSEDQTQDTLQEFAASLGDTLKRGDNGSLPDTEAEP